jgi:CBS-domain-containing membrane protein
VQDFPNLLHLGPPTVEPTALIEEIVAALSRDPTARSVFVTEDDRLVGAIAEHRLDANLVKLVLPQPLWSALGELDTRELMRAARGKGQTAGDLMTKCIDTQVEAPLGDVVIRMIREGQNVIALVDEQHRLMGYLSLFEILAELLRQPTP